MTSPYDLLTKDLGGGKDTWINRGGPYGNATATITPEEAAAIEAAGGYDLSKDTSGTNGDLSGLHLLDNGAGWSLAPVYADPTSGYDWGPGVGNGEITGYTLKGYQSPQGSQTAAQQMIAHQANEGSGLGIVASLIAAGLLGPEFLAGLGGDAAAGEAFLSGTMGASEAAGQIAAMTGAAGSGYTGTLAELAADGLGGVPTASSSVLDTAFEAAKSQLSNLLDPSKIGENALRSLAQQGASNLLQGRDLTSGMDIGNLIKGMGMNAGLSALTAGAGAGIQDATGLSKPVSSYLAQAGLNTARGGSPLSSLVGAGVEQFGPSTGVDMGALRKYATPAVTGLLSGKGLDPKQLLASGLANAAADQVPKNLGWADSGPLSWLQKGVTSGATGAVRNAVNKTLKG